MNAVRAEWYRLWRRRSPWGLLMASVACVFGYYVLTWASAAAASLAVSRGAPQPAGPGPGALVDALGLARFGTTGLNLERAAEVFFGALPLPFTCIGSA